MLGAPAPAFAQQGVPPADADNPLSALISGSAFAPLKIRAMQDDDFDNPGFPSVEQGEALWRAKDGAERKACVECHAQPQSMRTAGASHPKFSPALNRVVTLEQQINACRDDKMKAAPWPAESAELIAMTAYVRHEARGAPVSVAIDGPARPVFERGRGAYTAKIGQFALSCADCHNASFGKRYDGETLSQGHSNGFPSFSVGAKKIGSLHERFRACNSLVRAEPLEHGSEEYVALELYLAWRGKGLPVETPAVRP
ncbi:MAG: sulfur oxidation c-type cytochrome SoxA [Hyphomicrobiales bacterium]|nr:sulfur oxidation c-type cytochrome SoxA [Hyphomicrobiales bacterium]